MYWSNLQCFSTWYPNFDTTVVCATCPKKSASGNGPIVMRCLALVLIIVAGGCSQDLAIKYGYRDPQVPADIPRFPASHRARGLSRPDGSPKDLHQEYLVAYKEGFREAARQFEEDGAFKFDSIEAIEVFDATRIAVRGYWDGYTGFRKRMSASSGPLLDH
jgi:hypothetical protein